MTTHGKTGHMGKHFTSPAAAVERAKNMLKVERNLEKVSDSLFDTIVANEVGPATSLAARMLGDYRTATEAVHVAFEKARAEFGAYDGSDSPRAWVLSFVSDEAMRRSAENSQHASAADCDNPQQNDTEAALECLAPERRLAVVLTDVLGLTDEVAARISRVDLTTIRHRAASARSWIARHIGLPDSLAKGVGGAMG